MKYGGAGDYDKQIYQHINKQNYYELNEPK